MTAPTIIAEWAKNSRETVRVSLAQYQGRDTVDVRTWWTSDAGELRPGKSGITLAVRHLPDLASAITQALAEAKARGLIDRGQS
jgi:hypothetical protein